MWLMRSVHKYQNLVKDDGDKYEFEILLLYGSVIESTSFKHTDEFKGVSSQGACWRLNNDSMETP